MTTTATKQLIKSPAVGNGLLSWLCANGEQVEQGQPVARFTAGNNAHTVTATATGRLSIVTPHNITVQGGNPIGSIDPNAQGTTPPQSPKIAASVPMRDISNNRAALRHDAINAPQSQIRATTPTTTTNTPPESRHDAPQRAIEGGGRRGNIRPAPALEVIELREDAPTKRKPQRVKIVNRTYSISNQAERDIAKLAAKIKYGEDAPADLDTINESVLIRLGMSLVLDLPRGALYASLRELIATEKAGEYGQGRPKPRKK